MKEWFLATSLISELFTISVLPTEIHAFLASMERLVFLSIRASAMYIEDKKSSTVPTGVEYVRLFRYPHNK